MSAKRSTAVASKSDAVRKYLSAHPEAKLKEVSEALVADGVKVSSALINKIKYGGNKPKSKRGRKSKTRAVASSNGKGQSKAEAIRGAFAKLGRSARPKDVISHLGEQGVTVSAAQVSALRKKAGRRGRPVGSSASAAVARTEMGISLDHLLAAKRLADQVGLDAAKKALDVLGRLSS